MSFKEISPYEMPGNPFQRIGKDWMLVTAGASAESCNTMTASWGQVGILWNKPVATVYIRPQRYTRDFVEREAYFTCSFFAPGQQREALALLGSKSGRDGDKIAEAGLTPTLLGGAPTFAQAQLVLVCRKLYSQDLAGEHFIDHAPDETNYPAKDYHRMYVGEVEKVFVKED